MKKHFDYSIINKKKIDLVIDKNEVLRYLGYRRKEADTLTYNIIDECIEELLEIAMTCFVCDIYKIIKKVQKISLEGSKIILDGKDINKHLNSSSSCAVMAVTLGSEVDNRISYYSKVNLTKSLIFDACATSAVEALCDTVELRIDQVANRNGCNTTNRYSPGYGDLSLKIQDDILNSLNAQRHIGLTVTDSYILIPRKSVTAVIGIGQNARCKILGCEACRLNNSCLFAKGGEGCGNTKAINE